MKSLTLNFLYNSNLYRKKPDIITQSDNIPNSVPSLPHKNKCKIFLENFPGKFFRSLHVLLKNTVFLRHSVERLIDIWIKRFAPDVKNRAGRLFQRGSHFTSWRRAF